MTSKYKTPAYRRRNAVRYFMKEKLPRVKDMMCIQEGPAADIETWEKHYRVQKVPHAVLAREKSDGNGRFVTVYQIWKLRKVEGNGLPYTPKP